MSSLSEASHRPSTADFAALRAGVLISVATGIFQYLNSWIRLSLIPGDVEYHVHQLHFQQAVQVTLLNSLVIAVLLSAVWALGIHLRNSRIGETLQLFVMSLLVLSILRSILLVVPVTGRFGVEFGNFWLDTLACAVAVIVQRMLRRSPGALERGMRFAGPVSVVSFVMLSTLILPVLYALGRERAPFSAEATASAIPGKASGSAISSSSLPAAASSPNSPSSNAPSIVWVIFDEFDASIAWQNRPASMKLPQIDRFRAEAVNFTNASAPSTYTVTAIPSLLTGLPYDRVVRKEASDIILAAPGSDKEYSFRNTPNAIDWANEAGVPVSLVGWTHPYCRIFGSKLAQCAWHENPHMSSSQTWAVALRDLSFPRAVFAQMWQEGKGISADPCDGDGLRNLTTVGFENYRETLRGIVDMQRKDVRGFLQSGVKGLRILHLATPHPPGISRGHGELPAEGGGPDATFAANYATADSIFGEIRSILEERGEWDSSLVILTSDHGLRSFWELTSCLAEEDREMLRHRNDRSVPLIVKWPGGTAPATIDEPVSTLALAPMVRAYLQQEMATPDEFARWMQEHIPASASARLAKGRL